MGLSWSDSAAAAQSTGPALGATANFQSRQAGPLLQVGRVTAKGEADQKHSKETFVEGLGMDAAARAGPILVLPVMVEGEGYAELAEQRIRTRQAVMSGLAMSGYVPEDALHLGYVALPVPNAEVPPLVVPYQWCEPTTGPSTAQSGTPTTCRTPTTTPTTTSPAAAPSTGASGSQTPPKYDRMLILWIAEDRLGDEPLRALAWMKENFCQRASSAGPSTASSARSSQTWKVIGPRTSTVLRKMAAEAEAGGPRSLDGVEFISPTSTIPFSELLRSARPKATDITKKDLLRSRPATEPAGGPAGPGKQWGPTLERMILPDNEICRALVKELQQRHIHLSGKDGDHVALIAEWDTEFGRLLPLVFAAQIRGAPSLVQLRDDPRRLPPNVHQYQYLRGIDGRTLGAKPQEVPAGAGADERKGAFIRPLRSELLEPPEGTNQSDYIRRLSRELEHTDRRLLRERGEGLRAVGVLGSDLYDTLLILKALRPVLPHALFFTTTLDARLSLRSHWPEAHNLVVVTSYGLSLHPYYQRSIPPFRDTLQTATFAATLSAMREVRHRENEILDLSGARRLLGGPRCFEIGRAGAWDLSIGAEGTAQMNLECREQPPATIHPPRPDLAGWWTSWRFWWTVGGVAAASVTAFWLLYLATYYRRSKFELINLITLFLPFIILAVPLTITLVWIVHKSQVSRGEPFSSVAGVSVWPSVAVRLLVGLLCIHFIVRYWFRVKDNDKDVGGEFGLVPKADSQRATGDEPKKPQEPPERDLPPPDLFGFREWDVKTADKKKISAVKLWREYIRHGRFTQRATRCAIATGAFYLLLICLMKVLGSPTVPARGNVALWCDFVVTYLFAVPLTAFVTAGVIDATVLNRRFIRYLVEENTDWPEDAYGQCANRIMEKADLDEYLDIRLIARRTKAVGDVIYDPFLLVFLLLISRNSYFDNWDWPAGVIVAFALGTLFAMAAAMVLRQAAEGARDIALSKLRDRLVACTSGERKERAEALKITMEEIESERQGAFSVLSNYPRLAAILLPSGGLGIWALLQMFANGRP